MEGEHWAPELQLSCRPPDMMPSDTQLHHLVVAVLGVLAQVIALLHTQLWEGRRHVSLCHMSSLCHLWQGDTCTNNCLAIWATGSTLLTVGSNIARLPSCSD